MKSSNKIRLGLIGASRIAGKVLSSIRKVPEIEVVAVAAERPGKAKEFAKAHDIERAYNSYDDCFADPSIDAVYTSTLNSDHARMIEAALRANKHVLCEKPLVQTLEDAERLFSLAASKKLILLEGFMYRFHPQIKKLMGMVKDGSLGEIKSIRANFSFVLYELRREERPHRASSAVNGGALFDIGCYTVDFVNWIMDGETPIVIDVKTRTLPDDTEFDLSTSACLRYASGVTAMIESAVDSPSLNVWEVQGTKGSVAALRFDPQGVDPTPLYFVNDESEVSLIQCQPTDHFAPEFENFALSILGKVTPHISPAASIANARVLEMIKKAVNHSDSV